MNVSDALKNRLSANTFKKGVELSHDEIAQLVEWASESPTSFNSQNWHVIAVTDPTVRADVRKAAWDQAKVTDSAVLFAVLGNKNVVEKLPESMDLAIEKGVVDAGIKDWFVSNAGPFYEGKPELSRDEAIRSGSYLAMSLMLAGMEKGYGSGPMIGFDPNEVAKILNIPDNYVITVLIAMGPLETEGNWKRKPRRKDILSFNKFS